ncbi:MAG: shikimate dehydrogenase [Rikenellaceae bacterium]|nr:shikimate dehydrogenase [Rikenellaceae bacterium]
MDIYGIIGNPLGHSFSKQYFTEKFRKEGIVGAVYEKFQLDDISQLPDLIASTPGLQGLNVTIPYKQQVLPYLDRLDDGARKIGAVNCISFRDGKLTGHNTDAAGFRASLLGFLGNERPDALVLGTGGAAKAVNYVLGELGINFTIVSRTKAPGILTYGELDGDVMAAHRLIVNTTPLGTFPDVDASPAIPYDLLTPAHRLFDLVYNPEETAFMRQGAARGARTVNGFGMLTGQAEKAWEIWNGYSEP